LACIHFAVIIKILKGLLNNPHANLKYSLVSLGFIFIWDGFLVFIQILSTLINDAYFAFYATPCFLYLVLWIVFERSLLVYVWRLRNEGKFDSEATLRREMIKFYAIIYLSMFTVIIVLTQFLFDNWFLVVCNLYLIP
jgi:hypothetical protein